MTRSDRIDTDMRQAVERRLAEQREEILRRRDTRRRRLAELSERRRHGLRTRHARKLTRNEEN